MPMDIEAEVAAALILQQLSSLRSPQLLALHQSFGSFSAVFAADSAEIKRIIPDKALRDLDLHRRAPAPLAEKAQEVIDQCRCQGIVVLPLGDQRYPSLLREIDRPPPLLFIKGDPMLLALPQIAIVGSRNATASGRENARSFAAALAASGFVITSGLALGIDGAAHSGALERGKTIAVTGCGVDVVYPRAHMELHHRIITEGGAVVSEFPPAMPPLAGHFPRRNRIISGLSAGVLVVEAASRSGSLITARCAMEQGREVFAIPGSIHNVASKGCHQLLKQGATLVESASDIVEQLGGILSYLNQQSEPEESADTTEIDNPLLQIIGFDPVAVDTLVARSGLDVAGLNEQLLMLELAGRIELQAGKVTRIR